MDCVSLSFDREGGKSRGPWGGGSFLTDSLMWNEKDRVTKRSGTGMLEIMGLLMNTEQ